MFLESLEDRSLMASASLVGSELRINFNSTGGTAEYVEARHNGTTISVLGNITTASYSAGLINQITINDAGGGTNQYFAFVGGYDFNLPAGVSSSGVERFETFDVGTRVVTTGAGAINVNAPRGIILRGGTSLLTENGGITLTAHPLASDTSPFAGVRTDAILTSSGTGSISISGRGSAGNSTGVFANGTIRSTSAANSQTQGTITLQGVGIGSSGVGVMLGTPLGATVLSHAGNITIEGQGGSGNIQNYGVGMQAGTSVTGLNGANITITGVAGNGATCPGVNVNVATIQTAAGNITISGTGGTALFPAETFNPGIFTIGGNFLSNSGTINFHGTGGTSAHSNMGIYSISSVIRSTTGPVTLVGISGTGTSNHAISIDNQQPVSSGAVVSLIGDSIDIPNAYFVGPHISAPLVRLLPRTPGTPIRLVGGDVLTGTLALGLADHELDDIVANTLRIGDAAAGSITVLAANSAPVNTAWDVELVTGGDILFNAPLTTVGFFNPGTPTRGNLLLSTGPAGSVQPKGNPTDAVTQTNTGGAFTTSFTPGSDLAINVAGLTPHTQYDRLTASGAVNLAGADLKLTGGFSSSTGNVFTIVSGTSVTGIFNGLPDNSHVIFNGRVLRVNYSATTATLCDIGPAPSIDLAGRVFDDRDNDGLFNGTDAGIADVTVELYDESNLAVPLATAITGADGSYLFDANLTVGSYRVVAAQAAGLLDGQESAGSMGGTVNNAADSQVIQGIVVGFGSGAGVADGYNFAELRPSRVQGLVWEDANNNGDVDFGEQAIADVAVRLTGSDDRGAAVDMIMLTDSQGLFEFLDLRPSDSAGYTLTETQPADFVDGLEIVGTVNGVVTGNNGLNDVISQIAMTQPGSEAINYNFAELPLLTGGLQAGQSASIGFWHNKHGQGLIKSLNGGPQATQLANWLATTFPNMYGNGAGPNNLTGLSNAGVANFYLLLFKRNGKSAAGSGPPKMDAQALAVALAVYVTNENLAGNAATAYGFTVDAFGAGAATFNVAGNGAAFGVANSSEVRVLDLLLAVNNQTNNGLLFDLNGDGDTYDMHEQGYRTQANEVFSAINELGGV